MTPLKWVRLALEGAKLGLDVYKGLTDGKTATERLRTIQKRGEINRQLDEKLRQQMKK